jgi:hypothetical protein
MIEAMKYDIASLVLDDLGGYRDLMYITPTSPNNQRESLELMAGHFKREMRFDHLQYEACAHDDNCVGALICDPATDLVIDESHFPNYVVGGACFRRASSGDYVLDWIWLHPFARNRRKLRRFWPRFKDQFGEFQLTGPLSPHMKSFLEKRARA